MGKKESRLEYWAGAGPSSPPGLLSLQHVMAKTVCHLKDRHRCSTKVLKQCSVHDLDVLCIDLAPKYLISPSENHLPLKLTPPL